MFGKIHDLIYDSSLAEDCEVRWVFMDCIVLSDKAGRLDMTLEAFARRTNAPLERVTRCFRKLMLADPKSRSKKADGARLVPLDKNRDWGWLVVNKEEYRELTAGPDDNYRAATRERVRRYRAKQAEEQTLNLALEGPTADPLSVGTGTSVLSTDTDTDTDRNVTVTLHQEGLKTPSIAQVLAYAQELQLPAAEARAFHVKFCDKAAKAGGPPASSWEAALRYWKKRLLMNAWVKEFPAAHGGTPYLFKAAKDAAAADRLLACKLSVEAIIEIARKAWARPDDFWCAKAVSLAGFASAFNEIAQAVNLTKPAKQIPPHTQLRAIEQEISTHPANRECVKYDPKHTAEQRADLRWLRERQISLTRLIAHGGRTQTP